MEIRQNWLIREILEAKRISLHLLHRFKESPVLLVYLIVGTIIAVIEFGVRGLFTTVINWLILGAFAVLIFRMTENRTVKAVPIHRPKGELIAGLAFFGLEMLLLVLFWHLLPIPAMQNGFTSFIDTVGGSASNFIFFHGGTTVVANRAANAAQSVTIELVPTLILFFACGYGARGMGLRLRWGKLIIALLIFSSLLAMLLREPASLLQQPVWETLALFVFQILVNGFPEELFFRGFLLPRLEHALRNPVNALVLTSILFSAMHIPTRIAHGEPFLVVLLGVLNVSFPSGLLWGYLYQRTRSIVPGALLHTFDMFVPYLLGI